MRKNPTLNNLPFQPRIPSFPNSPQQTPISFPEVLVNVGKSLHVYVFLAAAAAVTPPIQMPASNKSRAKVSSISPSTRPHCQHVSKSQHESWRSWIAHLAWLCPQPGICLEHSGGTIVAVSGTARRWAVVMIELHRAYAGQRKRMQDENVVQGCTCGCVCALCSCQCQCQAGAVLRRFVLSHTGVCAR